MATTKTYACGEPSKAVGGGMPAAVVELTVDPGRGAWIKVVLNERVLGKVQSPRATPAGAGPRDIRPGDELTLEYVPGASDLELLRRIGPWHMPWREVTDDSPWWDGREFVRPFAR